MRMRLKTWISTVMIAVLALSQIVLIAPKQAFAATQTIQSSQLAVTIDDAFPRVIQYQWLANGKVMYGNEDSLSTVNINNVSYTPSVTFSKPTSDKAIYTLNFSSINVAMTVELIVVNNTLLYNVTNITESGSTKVLTVEIPNLNILSVRSTQTGAAFAGAVMYTQKDTITGDTFLNVTGTPATDASPKGYLYLFLNTNELAGGIWSNAYEDGGTNDENRQVKQTVSKTGYYRTGVWSGKWTYRVSGQSNTEPLPSLKVAITGDANGDSVVDWQDGAIAYRSIMYVPVGSDRVPENVVQRLIFPQSGVDNYSFLQSADETKRVYLNTDGLGQMIIHKNYNDQAWPQLDGAAPSLGGLADFNKFIDIAHQYNGWVGIHNNFTEAFARAKEFDDKLAGENGGYTGFGYWLDQVYQTNRRYDSLSGNRSNRLQGLKTASPGLDFIYSDVWSYDGWDGHHLTRDVNNAGLAFASEWPYVQEQEKIWSHWAVESDYSPDYMKGFNSNIARFIQNHLKDIWIGYDPLLMGADTTTYEGWPHNDNNAYDNMFNRVFTVNLPTKYMQHFPIMKETANTVTFANNVQMSNATGTRVLSKDGKVIMNGTKLLIPWDPINETKLYHWNSSGGSSTWQLPNSWSGLTSVKLYSLSDLGKTFVADLPVSSGSITINATANKAYVVYKGAAPATPDMNYGEGGFVKDPGFNYGDLRKWTVTGGASASVQRNSGGEVQRNYELQLAATTAPAGTTVSQTITGLTPGTYAASVYVEVTGGTRKAILGVKDYGGTEVTNYADESFLNDYDAYSSKVNTKEHRMRVLFDVPSGQSTATIYLKAETGTPVVTFDNVRVYKTSRPSNPTNAYYVQDFEPINGEAYDPFVMGSAGGVHETRIHISQNHAPYTNIGWDPTTKVDDVISGNQALKVVAPSTGIVLQTLPQTIRFLPNTNYKVSFKYEAQYDDYEFVIGEGANVISTWTLQPTNGSLLFAQNFKASATGKQWIGIRRAKVSKSDEPCPLIIDDLVVEDVSSGTQSAYNKTEASYFNSMSGVYSQASSEGGTNLGGIENGDYVAFNNVNFGSGSGAGYFTARTASATSGGNIEIRLDSLNGTLVGTCAVAGTGGWQSWTSTSCNVSGATGTHNVYLKFTGGSGSLFNVSWFKFYKPSAPPLDVIAKAIDNSTVQILWKYVPDATAYDVDVNGTIVTNVSMPYYPSGLSKNSTNTVRVRAKTAALTGDWSNTISVTTTNDPTKNPYSVIEAESWDSMFGVYNQASTENGENVAGIENGDYVAYKNLDFGSSGANLLNARVASAGTGGTMEVRLDRPNGPLAGTCTIPVTNGWQTWTTISCSISGATGVHSVYLKFTNSGGFVGNLNWFQFSSNQYEAESAALAGGAQTNTNHTGYQGTGFVDGYWNQGASTTFTVTAAATGNYNVTLRYANAMGSARTISLYVNGTKIKQLSLPSLADWNTWAGVSEALALNAGSNTISYRYDTGDSGYVNLDNITVQ